MPIILNLPNKLEVDSTLTLSGQAADAKVTGDALKNKQDKLVGNSGQMVGFDVDGNAVAMDTTINTSITIPAGRLVGDINGDGIIDSTDFNFLMGATGSAGIKYYGTNFENAFTSRHILLIIF